MDEPPRVVIPYSEPLDRPCPLCDGRGVVSGSGLHSYATLLELFSAERARADAADARAAALEAQLAELDGLLRQVERDLRKHTADSLRLSLPLDLTPMADGIADALGNALPAGAQGEGYHAER